MNLFDQFMMVLFASMRKILSLALFALEIYSIFGSRVNA